MRPLNVPARLGLFGGGLAVLFVAAFAVAGATVPDGAAAAWSGSSGSHQSGSPDAGSHDAGGAPTSAARTDTSDGYTATLRGDLSTNGQSTLTATVTKDGEPVTDLEPHLGGSGHLVALREGDLASLRVHPEGGEPAPGAVSGPDVTFRTEPPAPGRYLLYLDFKIDGDVHTARFVVDATRSS